MKGPVEEDDETVYHAYYQWVPLMLMFQAVCFYAPHWVWKQLDNGRMKVISNYFLIEKDREITTSNPFSDNFHL